MTSRSVTIVGFFLLLAAGGGVELAARAGKRGLRTIHEVLGAVQRTPVGRVGTFIGWFWIGWHFLAR